MGELIIMVRNRNERALAPHAPPIAIFPLNYLMGLEDSMMMMTSKERKNNIFIFVYYRLFVGSNVRLDDATAASFPYDAAAVMQLNVT